MFCISDHYSVSNRKSFPCSSPIPTPSRLVSLKFNKTYKTDITGDGKADRLKIVEKNIKADQIRRNQKLKITQVYLKKVSGYYYAPYYKVYVNGRYTWINPYMSEYIY